MTRLTMFIATGFGAGYLPKAPGTWGSLAALPLHFLLSQLSATAHGIALASLFFIAVITAGMAEKIIDRKDPGIIVIDEIIGMLVTLIGAPATPLAWAAAFLFFRFFDIAKPFPVSWIDRRVNGGLGIVMDDIFAGLYSFLALHLLLYVMETAF